MIARVYVDVGLPHLDKVFDYAVPDEMIELVKPGIRVKVPFSGRTVSAYVVDLVEASELRVLPISRIISDQVVMPPESVRLIRAVADHCAGTFMDVARLAIPSRYATVEKSSWSARRESRVEASTPCPIDDYPTGAGFRSALRGGKSPRASWLTASSHDPVGNWVDAFAALAEDALSSGRSAMLLVPDSRHCAQVAKTAKRMIGPGAVAILTADQGPQARYRSFLSAVKGKAQVLIGTRSAVYAPMKELGLIAVWEESDSSFEEPRFPYPHVRDIVAIRATQEKAGVIFASRSRSAEIQAWVEKGWLTSLGLAPASARFFSPKVSVASSQENAEAKDAHAKTARMPHDVFHVIREGLTRGPVLVWVPWKAYRGSVETTVEELRASFRHETVFSSSASWLIERVDGTPAIIVSTPGCEPICEEGYAAAVILDASGFLSRTDLRAGEKAVRRWMDVASLVRPGSQTGTVLIVGPPADRAVQAVVRMDPTGFAARELEDRREAGFPPATRLATFAGDEGSLCTIAAEVASRGFEVLGPMPDVDDEHCWRLIVRTGAERGEELARELQEMSRRRTARDRGRLTWRLDPPEMG